jgi:transmembrane sensor
MSEILRLRTRAEIDEEAAAWAWRMESETADAADRQAFESWLRRDPRHRRASEEMSRVWAALDGLADLPRGAKTLAVAQAATAAAARARGWWWTAAAAVLVAGIALAAWMQRGGETQTLATAVGEHRSVTLADGSTVTLNTNTLLEETLRRGSREIYLRHGEAHFHVTHDSSRPFLVHAGDALVRAVGTQFDIRVRGDQHVDVLVDEGRVEVRSERPDAAPEASSSIRPAKATARALRAGEQLSTATADYAVTSLSAGQLSSGLAWREGAIVFDGQSLGDAVAEIARYTDARIIISDPGIAALRVGGRFRTDNVQGFFDALPSALPVSVRRTPDGLIYVDPRR